MDTINKVDDQRITNGMRWEVESLASAADMISVCCEVAEHHAQVLERNLDANPAIKLGDWRVIYAMLRLAMAQAEIVDRVSTAFGEFKLPPAARAT